ncbi:hypothetical protein, conserved [Eimeria brunetti]|uniref:Transmembrane protein n=1 Tax=Eimeria brunetti TaxID=51314 RepID=U6LUJ7_9EIME|nr:hypothetical protein, conserved [Eimeria brunetti]
MPTMRGNFSAKVLWVCVLLRHEQLLPATEAFAALATAGSLLHSTGTLSISEYDETHSNLLQGASFDTFAARAASQGAPDLRPVDNSLTSDVPLPKLERRKVRNSALAKGFGAILALCLCFWLVSNNKGKVPTELGGAANEPSEETAGEEASAHDSGLTNKSSLSGQSEELKKLQKVRALLPSASRLAAAIGTTDAQKFLGTVQKASSEAEFAAEYALSSKSLGASFNGAMDALRSLHRLALQQATALAQDGAEVPVFSLVEPGEGESWVEDELGHILEGDTVLPFTLYLRSLQQSVIDISRRFEDARERLLAKAEFSDEGDEQMLVSATSELEWLLALSEKKRQVVQKATTVKGCAICGVRIHLKCHLEEWIRSIRGSAELLHAYVGLVSNSLEASFQDPSSTAHTVEDSSNAYTLSKKLADVKKLVGEMRKLKQAVHERTSVASAAADFKKAEQLMGEAQTLLDDCWETTKSLPSPNDVLGTADSALLERTAAKAQVFADEQNAAIGASLSIVYRRCSDAIQERDKVTGNTKHISPSVAERLRAGAMATEKKVAVHYQEMQKIATQLQGTHDLKDAISLLENLEEHLPALVECNKRALLLVLESYLQTLLEEDIQASLKAATRAFSSKLILSGPNKVLFEKVRGRFNRAKTAASEATNLTEAAQAAAKIRMHAEALSEFAVDQWRSRLPRP